MPQSITIAFFVLGAVLLLIAILQGGGFKIFGAEVDGSPGRFGRVFAGLLGVILIGIGLVTSVDKSLFQSAADGGKTVSDVSKSGESTSPNTSEAQEKQSSQTRSGKTAINQSEPLQAVNIAGTWHDAERGRVPDFPARKRVYDSNYRYVLTTQPAKDYCAGTTCFDETGSGGQWQSALLG
jgi:hypothetical protein